MFSVITGRKRIAFYYSFLVFLIVCPSFPPLLPSSCSVFFFCTFTFLFFFGRRGRCGVVTRLDSLVVFRCVCWIDMFFVLILGISNDIVKYDYLKSMTT